MLHNCISEAESSSQQRTRIYVSNYSALVAIHSYMRIEIAITTLPCEYIFNRLLVVTGDMTMVMFYFTSQRAVRSETCE
jgi:hypothetical protein